MANGTVSHTLAGPTTYSNTMAQGPAARKLSRGKSYTFTFPANGLTYSIKDLSASGYSTAGSNGRVTDGTSPNSVTNGGSITFTPNSSHSTNLIIRDEANGTDGLPINLTLAVREPRWTDGSNPELSGTYNTETRPDKRPHQSLWLNDDVNVYTESIWPLPAY